jgi:hypothetical protein
VAFECLTLSAGIIHGMYLARRGNAVLSPEFTPNLRGVVMADDTQAAGRCGEDGLAL